MNRTVVSIGPIQRPPAFDRSEQLAPAAFRCREATEHCTVLETTDGSIVVEIRGAVPRDRKNGTIKPGSLYRLHLTDDS